MTKPEEFLHYVIKALVDYPDDVRIVRSVDEMGVLYTLDLNAEDMGKIIGRKGNTAKAIRTLLRVVGPKFNERANLKINEPEGGSMAGSSMGMNNDDMSGGMDMGSAPAEPAPQAAGSAEVDAAIADLKDDMAM